MRFALALPLVALATAAFGVEHATIDVNGSGVPTKTGGTAGFFLDSGQTTGEYPIRIGPSAADDAAGGVLIGAVSQDVRNENYGAGGAVRDSSPNSNNTRGTTGGLALISTKAGPADPVDAGTPTDFNVSAGYFPFAEGWQGGSLYSSTVNNNATFGALDTLIAAGGIALDAQVQPNYLGQAGVSRVAIPGVVDAARQGVLMASTASNVGRYQTVAPSLDGDSYIVRSMDNDGYFEFDPASDPSPFGEGDAVDTPYSFVFVPVGTPGVTLARVATHGNTMNLGEQVGVSLVSSGANFSVTSNNLISPGQFRLEIDGFTPADGTLLVTPEGSTESQGGANADNLLTYEADATGWNILSQDIEADALYSGDGEPSVLNGTGQGSDGAQGYFSFVFVPNSGGPTAPGPVPAIETLTAFNRSRVIGWNSEVTSLSSDNNNDNGSTAVMVAGGGAQKTADVRVDQFGNRGDIPVAVDGEFLNIRQGLLLVTVSEGFRQNSAVGGADEYGVAMTTAFNEQYGIATATAVNVPGEDEHNVNFSAAFFGHDSGFRMTIGAEIGEDVSGEFGQPYDEAKIDVDFAGVNALTDGVLIPSPYENGDNFASAEPKADGSGWEVRVFDNTHDANTSPPRTEPDNFSFVYLPYDAENLTAGLVAADGSIVSSSPGAGTDWSLTKESDDRGLAQYRLSFTDSSKGPSEGMLLLVGTGDYEGLENQDNSMLYEVDGNDFLIRGVDHVSGLVPAEFTDYEDTGFMFAYVDFDDAPSLAAPQSLRGDFNSDGFVDAADYTVWRDNVDDLNEANLGWNGDGIAGIDEGDYEVWAANYGASLPVTTAAVPEPASALLSLVALASLLQFSRRAS